MKTALKLFSLFVISLAIVSSPLNAQVKGKIMDKSEGDALFGKATQPAVVLKKNDLEKVLKKAEDNVMFMIQGDKLVIATSLENVLTEGYEKAEGDVFHVFSKSVVEALLNYMYEGKTEKGEDVVPEDVTFEMREDVMTVTYGNFLLEFAFPCPPWCG